MRPEAAACRPAGGALTGALVLDVDDGESQELDDGATRRARSPLGRLPKLTERDVGKPGLALSTASSGTLIYIPVEVYC
jgi:hypothetical protein